ncbi:Uncharacterized ABC transporter ATP-binding protein YjjK [Chromobacterium violaceum]|uniref:Uncharacterized ABC transporter ATP-binding protein YjjK n=1 Tax=Chromobacterium violaceum TaxID=536 RepID=A0A3S4LL02_CHRVL|nr:Uncharacterized ABC transporter ATP-binding protein YjjK [Chromobacterium violaceum]
MPRLRTPRALGQCRLRPGTGEAVGLIGRNGAGKSSLLKGIAGAVQLDDGRINTKGDVKVAYVPQEPEFNPEHTVFEAVAEGLGELKALLTDYHKVTQQLTRPTPTTNRRWRGWKPSSTSWKRAAAGSSTR